MNFIISLSLKFLIWIVLTIITYYTILKCLLFIINDREKTLEKRLRYYYSEWSKGVAMIENEEYDKLKLRLEKMNNDNKFLRELKLNCVLGFLYEAYSRVRNRKVKETLKKSIQTISEIHDLNLGDSSKRVDPFIM
jgi:hypothetical protein